jgi:hypothetical protein
MLIVRYSAFNERMVVIDPAPAIRGKAMGTIDTPPEDSCLKSSIPRTISMPIRKIMKEPAIAKEDTSIPNILSKGLPMNKNAINIPKATREVFPGSISPVLALISRIIGIEPGISMIANKTMNDAKISIKLKCITLNLLQR